MLLRSVPLLCLAVLAGTGAFGGRALAQDILYTSETLFHREDRHPSELVTLDMQWDRLLHDQVVELVKTTLGGGELTTVDGVERLRVPGVGNILFPREKRYTHVVFEKIHVNALPRAQAVFKRLMTAGGKGTLSNGAVPTRLSTRVTARSDQKSIEHLLDLMRNYYSEEHRSQIRKRLKAQGSIEQSFDTLGTSFRSLLFSDIRARRNPHPGKDHVLLEYLYRPAREYLSQKLFDHARRARKARSKGRKAKSGREWEELGEKLRMAGSPRGLRKVMKELVESGALDDWLAKRPPLDIAPALAEMFPKDPIILALKKAGHIPEGAQVTFNELPVLNDVAQPMRQAHGLIEASKAFGPFDHDQLLSELSTVPVKTIRQIRAKVNASMLSGHPVVFRYFTGDPTKPIDSEAKWAMPYYQTDSQAVGVLQTDPMGRAPVVIDGESVVLHIWPEHRYDVVGKYNPGLVNFNLIEAMSENKWIEYLFFKKHAPGNMGETISLREVAKPKQGNLSADEVRKFKAALDAKFPKGWIIKLVADASSAGSMITSKDDLVAEVEAFQKSDFMEHKARVEKEMHGGNMDDLLVTIQEHDNILGYRISEALKNPDMAIAQAFLDFADEREYRVHAIGGKVLRGSTLDRWAFQQEYDGAEEWPYAPPEEIKRIEDYVQAEILDKLPKELRGMPFGFDVVKLKDGRYAMIESNPGVTSGFLMYHPDSVSVLTNFLQHYPELVKNGEIIADGLSPREQMKYLEAFFKENGIDPKVHLAGYRLTEDRVISTYGRTKVKRALAKYRYEGKHGRKGRSGHARIPSLKHCLHDILMDRKLGSSGLPTP